MLGGVLLVATRRRSSAAACCARAVLRLHRRALCCAAPPADESDDAPRDARLRADCMLNACVPSSPVAVKRKTTLPTHEGALCTHCPPNIQRGGRRKSPIAAAEGAAAASRLVGLGVPLSLELEAGGETRGEAGGGGHSLGHEALKLGLQRGLARVRRSTDRFHAAMAHVC